MWALADLAGKTRQRRMVERSSVDGAAIGAMLGVLKMTIARAETAAANRPVKLAVPAKLPLALCVSRSSSDCAASADAPAAEPEQALGRACGRVTIASRRVADAASAGVNPRGRPTAHVSAVQRSAVQRSAVRVSALQGSALRPPVRTLTPCDHRQGRRRGSVSGRGACDAALWSALGPARIARSAHIARTAATILSLSADLDIAGTNAWT